MARARAWKERPRGKRRSWSVVYERPEADGGGRVRRAAPTEQAAEIMLLRVKASLLEGVDPYPPGTPSLRGAPGLVEMAHAWLDDLERARKESTVERHKHSLVLFLTFLEERTGRDEGALRGSDVTTDAMRAYWEWLGTPGTGTLGRSVPRALGTKRKAMETAYLFARWASKDERFRDLGREPAQVPLPPRRGPAQYAPTWEQMAKVVQAMRTPWMRRAGVLMYYTGLRVNLQVMQLQWGVDVDLDAGVIRIARPELCKTEHEARLARELPISDGLAEELRGWAAQDGGDGDAPWRGLRGEYVIRLDEAGRGRKKKERELRGRDTKRAWIRALGSWPEGWTRPNHAFRHGFVHGLRMAGVDRDLVTYMVGQKSPYLVETGYSDLRERYREQMVEAVGKAPGLDSGPAPKQ